MSKDERKQARKMKKRRHRLNRAAAKSGSTYETDAEASRLDLEAVAPEGPTRAQNQAIRIDHDEKSDKSELVDEPDQCGSIDRDDFAHNTMIENEPYLFTESDLDPTLLTQGHMVVIVVCSALPAIVSRFRGARHRRTDHQAESFS